MKLKSKVLRLIKQGRKYGVGLVLATQNVSDIDYRGLSNVNTNFIGKLNQPIERKKILKNLDNKHLLSEGYTINHIETSLPGLRSGQFFYINIENKIERIKGRYICSVHTSNPSLDLIEGLVESFNNELNLSITSSVFELRVFIISLTIV